MYKYPSSLNSSRVWLLDPIHVRRATLVIWWVRRLCPICPQIQCGSFHTCFHGALVILITLHILETQVMSWVRNSTGPEEQQNSVECGKLGAEGAEWGGERTDGCGPAIEDWVSHGEEAEQKEQHSQHIEEQNSKAMWMFQCWTQCRKTHVVTEWVTQHRAYQVTWGGQKKANRVTWERESGRICENPGVLTYLWHIRMCPGLISAF